MRKALRVLDRLLLRWAWLIFLLLTIAAAMKGDAVMAALWGTLAGYRLRERISPVNPGERVRA